MNTCAVRRVATMADAHRLIDLWVEAWTAAIPDIDFPARRPWFRDYLRGLEEAGAVTVAAWDPQGSPSGFVTFRPAIGVIDQLVVATALQGRGLGACLLADVAARAPGPLSLTVNQANRRAVRFYERQGFVIVGSDTNARSGLRVWRMTRQAALANEVPPG